MKSKKPQNPRWTHPRILERRFMVWLSKVPPKYYPLIIERLMAHGEATATQGTTMEIKLGI